MGERYERHYGPMSTEKPRFGLVWGWDGAAHCSECNSVEITIGGTIQGEYERADLHCHGCGRRWSVERP